MNTETNPAGTMARLQAAEAELQRLRGQEPVDRCYSSDDGDIWFDADCDINLLESINPAVGDVVELLVSVIGWREKFKVVAAPDDDGNGEYEVEPLSPRNLYAAPVPPPDVRELVESSFREGFNSGMGSAQAAEAWEKSWSEDTAWLESDAIANFRGQL